MDSTSPSSSNKTTKCDGDMIFYDPLLPDDSVVHHLHYYAPPNIVPHHFHITVQTPRQKYQHSHHHWGSHYTLLDKFVGDVAIGVGVTFCVAPFLTVVDKAIVQRAAGTHTLLTSGMETIGVIARNPIKYIKSPTFLWMWGVYACTYSTANSLKTYTEHSQHREQREAVKSTAQRTKDAELSNISKVAAPLSGMAVFLGTSVVNSGGSLMKDRAYARMFGTVTKRSVPKISYGLWMTRDFLVVGSSFILPDMCSKYVHETYAVDKDRAKQVAQVTIPVAMQFIAGPLQLVGLDCYNRPLSELTSRQALMERGRFLASGFSSVVAARIARIVPGYSFGGVMNTKFRDQWRHYLRTQQESPLSRIRHFLPRKLRQIADETMS